MRVKLVFFKYTTWRICVRVLKIFVYLKQAVQTDRPQKNVWSRRKSELLKELLFNSFVIVSRAQFIEQIKNVSTVVCLF